MKHALSGKQTVSLKTTVTDEVSEEFVRFCRERGYSSSSDCLRELVLVAIFGADALANLHRERIDSLTHSGDKFGTGVNP